MNPQDNVNRIIRKNDTTIIALYIPIGAFWSDHWDL